MKNSIIAEMTKNGIEFIFVIIEGSGDSGDFVEQVAGKFNPVNIEFPENYLQECVDNGWLSKTESFNQCITTVEFPIELEQVVWQEIYNKMPGFENNEGGGTVLICSVPHNKLIARGYYNEVNQTEAFGQEE